MSVDLATQVSGKSTTEIAALFQEQVSSGQMTAAQSTAALTQLQSQGIVNVTVADTCITALAQTTGKPSLTLPSTKPNGELLNTMAQFAEGKWPDIADMDIGFMALLMGHKTKENLIETIKTAIALKGKEINAKSEYIQAEQIKMIEKQEELEKNRSIWDKVMDALTIVGAVVGAIVTTVIGVAVTVGTGGAAGVFAGIGIALAWGACACTIANVAIKHSDMDPETKQKWQMGLSIAGTVMGIASAICMGGAGTASAGAKLLSGGASLLSAGTSFAQGASTLILANKQKEIDEMKISLEKDKADLDMLQEYLEQIMQFANDIRDRMLAGEREVADEAGRMASVQEGLIGNIA